MSIFLRRFVCGVCVTVEFMLIFILACPFLLVLAIIGVFLDGLQKPKRETDWMDDEEA